MIDRIARSRHNGCNKENRPVVVPGTPEPTRVELEDLNAEAATLAATIKKNFEELGI